MNTLAKFRWIPAVRVLAVALLAQPAVAAVISTAAVRWPVTAAVVAVIEAVIGALPVSVTSEPAAADTKAPPS